MTALTIIISIAFAAFMIASMWVVFTKAGQPGWGALIPIYNIYLMLMIARRPAWWLVLFLVPFVNIVVEIMVILDIARNFGKSAGFAIGMIFLPFIFYPVLAFGDATYQPVER